MTARSSFLALVTVMMATQPIAAQSDRIPVTIEELGGVEAPDADARSYASEFPPHVRPALLDWIRYNGACRGGSGDRIKEEKQAEWMNRVCAARDATVGMMRLHGYCYGRRGEAGYENVWHACTSISLGYDYFAT